MSDDFGIGKAAGRRRRATRRLARHAARVVRGHANGAAAEAQPSPAPVQGVPPGLDAARPEAADISVEVPAALRTGLGPIDVAPSADGVAGVREREDNTLEIDVGVDTEEAEEETEPTKRNEAELEGSAGGEPRSPLVAALSAAADANARDRPEPASDHGSPAVAALLARGPALGELQPANVSQGFGSELPTEELELLSASEPSPAERSGAYAPVAESDRPDAAGQGEPESEVKTKPKIRLPDGSRRHSPRPPPRDAPAAPPSRLSSPIPPAPRVSSPLPPAPSPSGRNSRTPNAPTGEGIIRGSQPPRASSRPDRDSDVPTRPRIPLTRDMALAAGRVTSMEVPRISAAEAEAMLRRETNGEPLPSAPTVIVTRAHVISDRPPPPNGEGAAEGAEERAPVSYAEARNGVAARSRLNRRPRPDSEEFEMLDIDDGEERLEIPDGVAERGEIGVRVSRTPPPPPAHPQARRNANPAPAQRGAPPPPPPGAAKRPIAPQPAPEGGSSSSSKSSSASSSGSHKPSKQRRAWWETLFSDDYVRTIPRQSQAQISKQVTFMEASLGISRGDTLLDVGCGLGQHALEFAKRGYLVVALDLALSMITRAAEEAQQNGLRINILHKDIRDIGFEGTFDAVICVGTTFGFFDDEQNRGVLQRLANALKPGGRLLLEVVNRDYVIRSQPNLVWFEGDNCVVMEESDFNFYSSRLNVKRTMMREDGRQTESEYSVRLYSVHELGQLLKQAGFGIKEVSGQEATRGLFFGSHSTRIIMLAERRSGNRKNAERAPENGG